MSVLTTGSISEGNNYEPILKAINCSFYYDFLKVPGCKTDVDPSISINTRDSLGVWFVMISCGENGWQFFSFYRMA